jgi:glutathione S-transferase
MLLQLYSHPLSSFCQKVLVALYENGTPFEARMVDFSDAESNAALKALWPVGKIPVLRDERRGRTIPETTIIIEYVERHYPGKTKLLPVDSDLAGAVRLEDRFYDLYVNAPMQKIVGDRLRPAASKDPFGVEDARSVLSVSYGMIERKLSSGVWAAGDDFSMADCAAAPALFYANMVQPFGEAQAHVAAYLRRLKERPSFARVLREAEPYLNLVPK